MLLAGSLGELLHRPLERDAFLSVAYVILSLDSVFVLWEPKDAFFLQECFVRLLHFDGLFLGLPDVRKLILGQLGDCEMRLLHEIKCSAVNHKSGVVG